MKKEEGRGCSAGAARVQRGCSVGANTHTFSIIFKLHKYTLNKLFSNPNKSMAPEDERKIFLNYSVNFEMRERERKIEHSFHSRFIINH